MSGIGSTSSVTLPSAQSLFGAAGGTASTTPVAGPTVSGVGGTTTLPSAAPTDFYGTNPTPLDQPHPQYPGLIQSHVAVLQAIGTPSAIIQQISDQRPQAEYIDRYIQGEIMQNPEGWDDVVGNPRGTARAGLQQLIPGVQLPAPGQGNTGYMPDGSPVSGVNVPGLSTPTGPVLDPTTGMPSTSGGAEGLIKGLVWAGVAVGIGLIGWKLFKGKGSSKATEDAINGIRNLTGNGGAGWGAGEVGNHLDDLAKLVSSGKAKPEELAAAYRTLQLSQFAAGGGLVSDIASTSANTVRAATLDSIARGFGPADGSVMSIVHSSILGNVPFKDAAEFSLASRGMGVLEKAVATGQLGELATAR
ncbi:MAG: hypothetical protein KDC46_10905, partial [Thermoleophilia bacterium]|nr:hypothetical protein [Thermoleophilia bacterium]